MSRPSLSDIVTLKRAEEQMAAIRSLRLQRKAVPCLQCKTGVPKRKMKYGFCTKCFAEYRAAMERNPPKFE
jgi:hypothetical protein